MIHKSDSAYKSIGEVARILDLVNSKKGTLNTHTIRFWESEFHGKNTFLSNSEPEISLS